MNDEVENKLKRKVKTMVIAAMSLFFLLAVVAVFQFAIRINQTAQVNALIRQNEALAEQTSRAEQQAAYFDSDQFVRDFANRHLNRGRPGDKIFL